MKRFSIIILTFFLSVSALAYIPTTHFILDRVAASHGKGAYSIDLEVVFREGGDSYTARENWIVGEDGSLRVFASGPEGFRTYRLKKINRIYWTDTGRVDRSEEATNDYIMFPLLTRSTLEIKRFFVRWNIIPAEVLTPRHTVDLKEVKSVKELAPEKEDFVRLGRTAGAVTYTFGVPTPANSKPNPGLWVEQDAFAVRLMRAPSGAELAASDYAPYSKGLWFPRSQTLTFDNHSVAIRTVRVQSVELSRDQKAQLDASYLRQKIENT